MGAWTTQTETVQNTKNKYGLHTFFRGNAAETFRENVHLLGFTEETYPYNKSYENDKNKSKVLRIWEGTDYEQEDQIVAWCEIIQWEMQL